MKKLFLSILVVGALAGCTAETAVLQDRIVVSEARIQAPMKGKTMTAGYFDITNHSDVDDAIIGIETPDAERIEMHLTEADEKGIMSMRRQVSVDLKAGDTVSFKPGSYHLMVFGVNPDKQIIDMALTLKFKHAPDMTIIAETAESALHTGHNN